MSYIGNPRKGFNVIAYNQQKFDRERKRKQKYFVRAAALGKFTATTNPDSERASSRDYRTFDTREEAEAWAAQMNSRN